MFADDITQENIIFWNGCFLWNRPIGFISLGPRIVAVEGVIGCLGDFRLAVWSYLAISPCQSRSPTVAYFASRSSDPQPATGLLGWKAVRATNPRLPVALSSQRQASGHSIPLAFHQAG